MYKYRSVKAFFLTRTGRILLVKKNDNSSGNAGKYEFPGGKVEGCEEPISALLREVREEVGNSIMNFIDTIEEIPERRYFLASDGKRFFQQFFFFIVLNGEDEEILGKIKLSDEHTECVLTSEDTLPMLRESFISDAVAFALKYFEK